MVRTLVFTAALVSATAGFAAPRAAFLRDAVRGDYSEMTLGRVIESRAATAQVRRYGSVLARDHAIGLRQARSAAARAGLHIPVTMMPEARSELRRLQHLRGRAFDLEVRRYMIDDHRKDLSDFREQARSGDRLTAPLAAATIPVLRRHLALAEAIRG